MNRTQSQQTFQNPENAIRRAQELKSVGQHAEALNVLHHTIGHRRFRTQGWDEIQEKIMLEYVDLCVKLPHKLRMARDGLSSFRAICHQNISSLIKVLKRLSDQTEKCVTEAKASAAQLNIAVPEDDDDDLEAEETPESLMGSVLSNLEGDGQQDTNAIQAALKQCWEAHKILLDVTRTTPKLESFYHDTARNALQWCLTNRRPTEFKRLCEIIRSNYSLLVKTKTRQTAEGEAMLKPELHLETRMHQLKVATALGQWQESFQTVEDLSSLGIHDQVSKAIAPGSTRSAKDKNVLLKSLGEFYDKLAQIFLVSGNMLFHAQSWIRFLCHSRNHKIGIDATTLKYMSSIAVLAVLSVPPTNAQTQSSLSDRGLSATAEPTLQIELQRRLAALLGLSNVPTRESLKTSLITRDILEHSSTVVRRLYAIVEAEEETMPLEFCAACRPYFEDLQACGSPVGPHVPLSTYVTPVKAIVFEKLLRKLSEVYSSVSVAFFSSKVCPEWFLSWSDAESLVVSLVQKQRIQMRLDYANHGILFGDEDTQIENMIKTQLAIISQKVNAIADFAPHVAICGKTPPPPSLRGLARLPRPSWFYATQRHFYEGIETRVVTETQRLLARTEKAIDDRKREAEEKDRDSKDKRRVVEETQKKEATEKAHRDRLRLLAQEQARTKEERRKAAQAAADAILTSIKRIAKTQKLIIKDKNWDEITAADILNGDVTEVDITRSLMDQQTKEREEMQKSRHNEARRLDHYVRALWEEGISLYTEWSLKVAEEDEILEADVQEEKRLARVKLLEDQTCLRPLESFKQEEEEKERPAVKEMLKQDQEDWLEARVEAAKRKRREHEEAEKARKEAEAKQELLRAAAREAAPAFSQAPGSQDASSWRDRGGGGGEQRGGMPDRMMERGDRMMERDTTSSAAPRVGASAMRLLGDVGREESGASQADPLLGQAAPPPISGWTEVVKKKR